jgi:hypothetical protein
MSLKFLKLFQNVNSQKPGTVDEIPEIRFTHG